MQAEKATCDLDPGDMILTVRLPQRTMQHEGAEPLSSVEG